MRFLIALLITILTGSACADVLVTKSNEKHFGIILRSSADSDVVTFAVYDRQTDKFTKKTFDSSETSSLIPTIPQLDLSNLDFRNLESVRTTAENLAGIDGDLSCNRLAVRLFILLIHQAQQAMKSAGQNEQTELQELISSACRNLLLLAKDDPEKKLFSRIASIYSDGILTAPQMVKHEFSSTERSSLLKVAQLLRRKQFVLAGREQARWTDTSIIPPLWNDFFTAIIAAEQVTRIDLLNLLDIESQLTGTDPIKPRLAPELSTAWLASMKAPNDLQLTRLTNLFEFDFEATQFADGKWLRPVAKR